MRKLKKTVFLLLLMAGAASLCACGKRGPLYLPSPPPPHAPDSTK